MGHINKMFFKSTNKKMRFWFGVILRRRKLHKHHCKLKSCLAKRERENELNGVGTSETC